MKQLRTLISALAMVAVFAAVADQTPPAAESFGAPMPEGEPISLRQAIAALEAGDNDGLLKIEGQVTEVCQVKGCWMILVDGDVHARVTFENYGFFVPITTSMQHSVVYGVLSERLLSGEEARHFAQDAGAKAVVEQDGEIREYSIVARSVHLETHG